MIRSLRGYRLLDGVRAEGALAERLGIEMLLRLDRPVHDLPGIVALDLAS